MGKQATATMVLGSAIVEWLADEALEVPSPPILYGELCQRVRGVGIPIMRGQVAFRVLHPLYDASTLWGMRREASLSNTSDLSRAVRISSCAAPSAISSPIDCRSCVVG